MDFKTSQTMQNLMRAFAGESQARNRYTFAAEEAKKQKMPVVQYTFLYTANQEKEHAEIFYDRLNEMAGQTIRIDGGYPVDISGELQNLLRMAEHNENEEHDDVYKHFGDIAKDEGFADISNLFYNIAKIEKTHANRFARLAELIEQNQLFSSPNEENWMCLNCGYIVTGRQAPQSCPVCKHEQGYFIRANLAPFQGI